MSDININVKPFGQEVMGRQTMVYQDYIMWLLKIGGARIPLSPQRTMSHCENSWQNSDVTRINIRINVYQMFKDTNIWSLVENTNAVVHV